MRKQSTSVALRATKANAGIRDAYYKRLRDILQKMSKDVETVVKGVYSDFEPLIAQDATLPSKRLGSALKSLRSEWNKRFKTTAEDTATWFAKKARGNVARSQRAAMSQAGVPSQFTVKFSLGNTSKDVFESIVQENVSLIQSIGEQYLSAVEGEVMRSVQAGRDLKTLATTLSERYDISRRRAALIARDQNNKATESLARANDLDAGVAKGVWIHIAGRKSSRHTHEKMDGKEFDLKKGMWDSAVGQWIHPGELIACNCTYRPVFTSLIEK